MSDEMIHKPLVGDPDRAEEVLDEIAKVLRKHRCLLVTPTGAPMNLAVEIRGENNSRAIAKVEWIGYLPSQPLAHYNWHPIDWTQTKGKPQ